ncbi:winged helix-turn-helix domain-containing protein [Streptomyces abyssomicinicus]|uniref:winged helix-turn-helix domain-containing protein n=1 Tax=Streptomyces abyssomicinicus TaxID=574929 RepID=UPI001250BDFC|nr:winged helix-turn-helix domain-containing protein [Streptomyces abyssomicinicus]
MATTHASDLHVPAPRPYEPAGHRRLRAVGSPETAPSPVDQLLPPGATWLPAPPQAVPSLPGQPPMVGYLVLVPADRQPPFLREATTRLQPSGPGAASGEEAGDDGLIRVDTTRRTAEVAGEPLELTYLEFELLAHLVAHPHRVHTRDQLVATVWGYGHVGDGRTVDVHVARLRRKLGDYRRTIQTVRRVGYRFTPPVN